MHLDGRVIKATGEPRRGRVYFHRRVVLAVDLFPSRPMRLGACINRHGEGSLKRLEDLFASRDVSAADLATAENWLLSARADKYDDLDTGLPSQNRLKHWIRSQRVTSCVPGDRKCQLLIHTQTFNWIARNQDISYTALHNTTCSSNMRCPVTRYWFHIAQRVAFGWWERSPDNSTETRRTAGNCNAAGFSFFNNGLQTCSLQGSRRLGTPSFEVRFQLRPARSCPQGDKSAASAKHLDYGSFLQPSTRDCASFLFGSYGGPTRSFGRKGYHPPSSFSAEISILREPQIGGDPQDLTMNAPGELCAPGNDFRELRSLFFFRWV